MDKELQVIEIDCNASPVIPVGLRLVSHDQLGAWLWVPNITLLKAPAETMTGHQFFAQVQKQTGSAMNACVLDAFLARPALIPDVWGDKFVYFGGTQYLDEKGRLAVRCLYRKGSGWGSNTHPLEMPIGIRAYAALH